MAPRGKFVLSKSGDRPIVLVSGGVGVTPMMAMAEQIVAEGKKTGRFRPVHFIHGAQSGKVHAFRRQLDAMAAVHPEFKVHFSYSRPAPDDLPGKGYHSQGTVSIDTIKSNLSFADYEFYLCGPAGFMKSVYDGLTSMGVSVDRIFYESFGPATILKPEAQQGVPARATEAGGEVVRVRFARSNVGGDWARERGTLLEFAESLGVAPKFGCRSGICSTCTTRILSGAVDYIEDPVALRGAGDVLLCCSVPRAGSDVVLDL
jgi:ferredoxin-NADP reductase